MAATKQKLIILESPAKARTISKFLGKGYKVEACQGHVCDLPKSQLGVDVDNDFALKYITIRGRGDILTRIRKEAKTASQVILATDPDREGEAISWHLGHILGIDTSKPCRIEFHEVTKKAVKEALTHPRPLDMGLVDAQQARRVLDRLVGYKISPLLWAKVKKGLSAGRVQSVATRMVVMREQDIEAFIPEEYWDIAAQLQFKPASGRKQSFQARLSTLDGQKAELPNAVEAEDAARRIREAQFTVSSVKRSERRKMPAAPFTTSSLQQEANRKLGFTTARTMQVVQQLYEGVDLEGEGTQGLVTYIRTDSVRISDDALAALRSYIPERFGEEFLPEKPNEYKGRKNAQDAHEAIRPTDVRRTPESIKASLSKEQFNLYRLIYNRFLASQMMPAVFETVTIELTGNGVGLRFYGEHKKFPGFTSLYEESTDEAPDNVETSSMPQLQEGDTVTVEDVISNQHFTQPPPRYNEASLVDALEEKGIGRPSTFAPTITTIIARGYVSREKRQLYPTELGRMVTSMMEEYFADIVDMDFTADMEDQLDRVEEGGMDWKQVLRDFYPPFEKTLAIAEQEIEKVEVKDEPSDIPCDKCGAMMVYKMGRFGKFLACPNFPDCRNTMAIATYIEAPCPVCGARLMEKTSRKNRKFYGCERYPDCDFVSWEKPVTDKCPQCGGYMVEKRNRKGEVWHLCANETCRCRIEVPQSEEEE
ncbi:MAG: type I DNA topoisomerase [Christensenellaceae bacterium]|nr:type I DNA topoisomerase [Christensenellaceae bacterium]